MPDYRIIYVSEATRPPSAKEIARIVETARRNNAGFGVTGLMIYFAGRFFQVLEGPPEGVSRVFERVKRDPRHRNLQVVHSAPAAARAFPEWRMGYATPGEIPAAMRRTVFSLFDRVSPVSAERGEDREVRLNMRDLLAGFGRLRQDALTQTA